jgi:hypothetical protein
MRDNWMRMEENPPPKDGTFFFAYTPAWNGDNSMDRYDIVFWGCYLKSSLGSNYGWCIQSSFDEASLTWATVDPTHWMRLESPHE